MLPAAGILLRLGQPDLLGKIETPIIGPFFDAMSAAGDAALAPGVDTPDQAALRDSVRSLLEKRAGSEEMRAATRAEHGYDESLWSALAGQIGASALGIPETYDGAGASYLETHLVADELGRSLAPSPLLGSAILAGYALLAGAALIATENAPEGKRAIYGTFPQLGAPVGFIIAAALFAYLNTALPRAEKFAGAADVEVLAGDFEAVGVFVDDFQPRFGEFAQGFGKQEDAHAFCRAAPYPSA